MTAALTTPASQAMATLLAAAGVPVEADDDLDPDAPAITDDDLDMDVPFYGVAAPEGLPTGDRRKFDVGSLRVRDLPLPLRFQYVDAEGHGGSVPIGRIDNIWRDEASHTMRYEGVFHRSPDAEQAIDLIANRVMRGVSVDLDDTTVEMQNEDGTTFDHETWQDGDPAPMTVVTDGRIASMAICSIPAFQEAFIAIGTWADDEVEPVEPVAASCETCEIAAALEKMTPEHREQFVAAFGPADDSMLGFTHTAEDGTVYVFDADGLHVFTPAEGLQFAPGTHDGPGWITHPRATERIRRYWVHGKGAAKIRWGMPGDFNRCRKQLAKYVKNPDWLAGLCANMHKEAIKVWPGREGGKRHAVETGGPAFALVASAQEVYPHAWFENPHLDAPTPITVDGDRIFGHVAQWGVCHIGISGVCTEPPSSPSGYAHYLLHSVLTDQGRIPAGVVTMSTGHAGQRARLAAATAHYDNTGTLAAKVNAGEDDHGIWIAGVVSPGLSEAERFALDGATLSGDWREDSHHNLELVAALAVNTPGFPIQHASLAASGDEQISLVAAGIVRPRTEALVPAFTVQEVAEQVLATMAIQERQRVAMDVLRAARRDAAFAVLNQ